MHKWTPEKAAYAKHEFLRLLRGGLKPKHAAIAIKCSLAWLEAWRKTDEEFDRAWIEARNVARDRPSDWRSKVQTRGI